MTRIQVWSPSKVIVHPSDGSTVEAKDAVYLGHTAPSSDSWRVAAVVFINPATGHVWAGPRADDYLETLGWNRR